MLNVGILDDRLTELNWSNNLINQYLEQKMILHQIFLFQTEGQLKHLISKKKESMDIMFLDIELNESSGIEIAKWLNETMPICQIVFLTNYTDYFMDVYKTDHCYYILKSELSKRINNVFDRIEVERNNNQNKKLVIESNGKKVVLNQNEILYLEKEKRLTHIQCEQQRFSTYQSFEEIIQVLNQDTNNFLRCHKSFIVSLNHITSYSKKEFIMNNGINITISRKYKENVNREFFEWGRIVGKN